MTLCNQNSFADESLTSQVHRTIRAFARGAARRTRTDEDHSKDSLAQDRARCCRYNLIGFSYQHRDVADVETIERARSGDRDAVAAMWRIYQPQVLRLLVAKRAVSPEDVASQVWVDVSRSLGRFEGDGTDFRRWIFTIASRRSIDGHRHARRHDDVSIEARHDEVAARGTDAAFEANDSLEQALAMVRQLSPSTAEAVMLRVVYDLSVGEVAAIMGRSDGAVRVLVHRGLGRLRELVVDESNERDSETLLEDVTLDGVPALT